MIQPEPQPTTIDCIFENILGYMLPFFLSSAAGDMDLARAAIRELAEAYNAATATELELVGRLIGFSIVSMDNLRLSMDRDLSATNVLRYRSNAVALSRAGEQCRKILDAIQARRPHQKPIVMPSPSIATAPPPQVQAKPNPSAARALQDNQHPKPATVPGNPIAPPRTAAASRFPEVSEAAMKDARMLLAMFANNSGASALASSTFPHIPDPAASIGAAVTQAFRESRRNAAV